MTTNPTAAQKKNEAKAKHTPGPWEAFNGPNAGNIGIRARGAADLFRVATVPVLPMDGMEDEARANSRLIAQAPRMAEFIARFEAADLSGLKGTRFDALCALVDDARTILAAIDGSES